MSMGPTAEPDNFPPPPPVTPTDGPIDVPGSSGSYRTPSLPDSGPGVSALGGDRMAPGNAPGPLIVPGDNQPDGDPPGIMTAPGVVHDAGNDDKMESTVAGSVAAANARMDELASDLYGTASTVGDLMALPDGPLASSKVEGPPAGYSSEQ